MVSITVFDGVNCIGGNKILLEDGDSRLFFDFGMNFGAEGSLYDEFMKPKPAGGLYEYIQLGLLPPIKGIYRDDFIPSLHNPFEGFNCTQIDGVDGVLVSHAHVDHTGYISFLRKDIPIYSTAMSAAIMRAMQDTGQSGLAVEYCNFALRDNSSGLVKSDKTGNLEPRPFRISDFDDSISLQDYWNSSPMKKKTFLPRMFESADKCGSMTVKSLKVDHSIYGSTAWAVETSAGWVIYSGDIRTTGKYANFTYQFAEEAAKLNPIALIIEGTRINSNKNTTEASIKDHALDIVKNANGLVIADFGPRNVERLITFLEIARETNRDLVLTPKDLFLLKVMSLVDKSQYVPRPSELNIKVYERYSSTTSTWQKELLDEYASFVITPQEVSKNQDKFICCFSYWDANELAYIQPKNDSVWVYSSCEAFNEEMEMDIDKLLNWINRYKMKVAGNLKRDDEQDPLHVSGHASGPDIKKIIETIRPKYVIPVHCTSLNLYPDLVGDVAKIIYPEKGVPISF
ncbi:MAG: MBL fold metallo-hydrolase RNA specificity domain-containing protein [Armatimonadota bacterium]